MCAEKRDLLTLYDLAAGDFKRLFELSGKLKSRPHRTVLKNKTVALIFSKSSTRTRVSFEVGISQLGGHSLFLSQNDIQLGRGETVEDTATVLSRYVDGIVIRTYRHSEVENFARNAAVPVINGLTDEAHPCQVLADLWTIIEKLGSYRGKKLVFLGDCRNNMAYSWITAASLLGIHLVLSGHSRYRPAPRRVREAHAAALKSGGRIECVSDPKKAVRNADVIYTDVWTSMGQESESRTRRKLLEPWQVNRALLEKAAPHAIFMHCLPAHRGEEVTPDVLEDGRSAVWDQAENRLHVQKAILMLLLDREKTSSPLRS
jgi:ornithine carbamoyltransferase